MQNYLINALRVWYMDRFWRSDKFFRTYPKEYAFTRIVKFIDVECRTFKGQNYYKGYPFVYYAKKNIVRCGLIIAGHIYYSSFNFTDEKVTVDTIKEKMDRVISQHGHSYLYSLLYATLIECGAKETDLRNVDGEYIKVVTNKGYIVYSVVDTLSYRDAVKIKSEIEKLY